MASSLLLLAGAARAGEPGGNVVAGSGVGGSGGAGYYSCFTGACQYYSAGMGGLGDIAQGANGPAGYGRRGIAPYGTGTQGIVIIRYPGGQVGSVSSWGGYTVHTFTSSGTFTP